MTAGFERNKHLPPIDLCIDMLEVIAEGQGYEGKEEYFNHYSQLATKLNHFKYDPTFSRARHIWLEFKRLNLQPAKEIESVLIEQLSSDDTVSWKYYPPPNAPRFADRVMNPPSNRLDKFEKNFSRVEKKLKLEGRKAFKGDVYDEIARLEAMPKGKRIVTCDAIRKRHERLKNEVKENS